MRVLICDQESEMLERIAREFEVDVATSKVTCIDLMRANPFDVVVASERLVDGSGLELLSNVATRWPDTLRVLAIEPERRKMLGGKLAPFRLHATIRYPIDEDELERRLAELDSLLAEGDYEEEESSSDHDRAPAQPQRPPLPAATRSSASHIPARANIPPSPVRTNTPRSPAPPSTPPNPTRVSTPPVPTRPGTPAMATRQSVPPAPARTSGPGPSDSAPSAGAPLGRRDAAAAPPQRGPKTHLHQSLTGKPYSSTASGQPASAPHPVRRKLGNYTPLGAPEDADLRIVAREFDETIAPLAARAIRAREEANRERTPSKKVRSVADHVSRTLKRLLKR